MVRKLPDSIFHVAKSEEPGHRSADQKGDESTLFGEGNRENDRESQPHRRSGDGHPVELGNLA